MVRATDRRGQIVRWFKDSQDRDTLRVAGTDSTRYGYDPKQRWIAARNAESTDTLNIDAAGRPSVAITVRGGTRYVTSQSWLGTLLDGVSIRSYDAPNGGALWTRTISSGYDAERRVKSMSTFGGAATQIRYDKMEFERTITLPSSITVRTNTFSALGELTAQAYTGAAATFSRTNVYDNSSRIALTYHGPPSDQFDRFHDYDSRDRLASWRDIHQWSYTVSEWIPWDPYDDCPGCMILQETYHEGVDTLRAEAYAFDKIANRTGAGIAYQSGGGNRLVQFNGETFTYDAEGNLTQRTGSAGSTSYGWNGLGQLVSVASPLGTTSYGYDGWGQRVRKTVNGGTTRYLVQNDQVVMELDAYNGIVAEYTYYPGTDRPHGMRRGGAQYYYVQDAQGNVSGLIHSNGAVVESYGYSPQGELLSSTGGVTNPYRFKGREWDAEAGLYFMRARYYDPKVGRFVSEDPIGLAGGVNPYAFAMGDPVNHRDPSGLCPFGDNGAQLTILVDDCPPDDPRTEVFKLISRNGMGRSIIAAIVRLQIMVSFYEVRTECPATSAGCTIGKRVLIEATERIGVVDRQGNVVHEVGHVFMNMSAYPQSQKAFFRGEMFAYALGWNYLLTLTPEERSQSRFADYLMLYSTSPRAALGKFCWEVWLQNTTTPGASC